VRDLATAEADEFQTTVLVPAVRSGPPNEADGDLRVRRFRYFLKPWQDLAEGAILENLRTRPSRWLQVPFFLISEVIAVRRLVQRSHPDVIHAFWIIPQGLAALIAAPSVPKVVTTLGGDLYGLNDPLSRWLIRMVLRNAVAVTTMNSDMRDRLLDLGAVPSRTHVLPMGADLTTIRPIAASQHRVPGRVLFVGRLVEKKGAAALIEAMRLVGDLDLDLELELCIVGDGPLEKELKQQAEGLRVRFLGALKRPQLAAEYGKATVAVFPSVRAASGDQDGLPVALLEAMGAGCAVVASRLPGLADVVEDGVSGILVSPGAPWELAAAIGKLVANSHLADELGRAAGLRSDSFSTEAIGLRYVELLKGAL